MQPKDAAFFTESNIVPGQQFAQIFEVHNTNPQQRCHVVLQARDTTDAGLASLLTTSIVSEKITYFGDELRKTSLRNLFDAQLPTSLGILKPKASRNYVWTVDFDSGVGNSAQALELVFSADVTISCADEKLLGSVLGARTEIETYEMATPISKWNFNRQQFFWLIPIVFFTFILSKYALNVFLKHI